MKSLPPPKVEILPPRPCPNNHGPVTVKRITTHVERSKPVEMGYCQTCQAAVA